MRLRTLLPALHKFVFAVLILFSCSPQVAAQQLSMEDFKGISPRSIGPAGMSGRVTSIDALVSNPDMIWVGTASGGLWKTSSGGIEWEPLFDKQPLQSIGAVTVDQNNPDVIWAGTGEGNPRNSANSGRGIYRSLDGGRNWELMGLENTRIIHRIILHRDDPNTVFVAAMGSAWGPNKERGVYKTTDGGKSWKQVLYLNDQTGCADLVVDPSNPNKLIAAMWEYGREPWFFNSGGVGSGMHVTYDGGDSWKRLDESNGLPKGELGRMGLAIAPSNPKVIYAYIEAKENAIYRSTDGGHKWTKRGAGDNIGNRPFYYADIYVDTKNENRVYSLWSRVSRSEDGGKNWEIIIPYNDVHPDHHAFWIHPEDPSFLIDGNDGGMAISRDMGKNWRFVENLPLGQFYHINVDNQTPYNVYGGMQDNGSWVGPGYVWRRGGIANHEWQEVLFGDGFDVMPRADDPRYGFAMYQGGNLYMYDMETGANLYIKPEHPDGLPLRFNWNAALAQDPHQPAGIYFGSQFVHYSADFGENWKIISPDLTTDDSTKQRQNESGGLTIDATRAENYTTILTIAPSTLDASVIWAGTDDGHVQLTRDAGGSWTEFSSRMPGLPKGAWICQIVASKHDAGEAFVVANDYRRNNWQPYLYRTKDFGASWTRIAAEPGVDGYCMSVAQDPVASELLFLGTDYGLYVSLNGGKRWSKWTKDFPSVPVADLAIQENHADLVIGTYGRAAYVLDDIRPLRELSQNGVGVMQKDFAVFDPGLGIQASYKAYAGVRFTGDGAFKGENRRRGAMITYWMKMAPELQSATAGDPNKAGSKAAEEKARADKKRKGKKKAGANDPPTTEQSDQMRKDSKDSKAEDSKDEKTGKDKDKDKGKPKIKVWVLNTSGDTIRYFTALPDTGFNRIYWDLYAAGVRFPSWEEPKKDADDPRGMPVEPGTYKLLLAFKDWRDSTSVEVIADPRLIMTAADRQRKREATARIESAAKASTEAFNRLKEARKTISQINKNIVLLEDSVQKPVKEMGSNLEDSLKKLQRCFLMPQKMKGIQREADIISARLWTAYSYLNSNLTEPTDNGLRALEKVEKELTEVLAQINAFFETDWKAYQDAVDALDWTHFKEYEPIKME